MRHDPERLKAVREAMAMTQDQLAISSNVSERTVQRAEAGFKIRLNTLSDFAAALRVPLSELAADPESAPENGGVSLRRVKNGVELLDDLGKAGIANFDCDVHPAKAELDSLLKLVRLVESLLPQPWEAVQQPAAMELSRRIALGFEVSNMLAELKRSGVALFSSLSWISAQYPQFRVEDGQRYTYDNQAYQKVQTIQLLLCRSRKDRVYRDTFTSWMIPVEQRPQVDWDRLDRTLAY